jgi:hypothetical protein
MGCIMELIHIIVMSVTTNWVGDMGNKTYILLDPFYIDCRNYFAVLCACKQIYYK